LSLLMAGAQAATVSSSFDSGLDGWTTYANGGDASLVWEPTGGQSGGYLRDIDTTDEWGWLLAPAAYTNALRTPDAGGMLSFYLRSFSGNDAPQFPVRIAISNGSLSLMAAAVVPSDAAFGAFSFNFDASTAWHVVQTDLQQAFDAADPLASSSQIAAVLAGLTGLYIAADYNGSNVAVGGVDHTLLDTVALDLVIPDAAPEPLGAGLVLTAMAGLLATSRRRRS
jgi:hypothetical protein